MIAMRQLDIEEVRALVQRAKERGDITVAPALTVTIQTVLRKKWQDKRDAEDAARIAKRTENLVIISPR